MYAPLVDRPAVQGLAIDTQSHAGRVLLTIRGELGLGTARALETALGHALKSSFRGVDLDLGETAFCDCAALNVLIAARRHALDRHKTLTVRFASPTVLRLLTLTGTLPLFAPEDHEPAPPHLDGSTPGEHALNRDEQELRKEVAQLRRAMQTRPAIDQARGMLMASFGLTAEDAWTVLLSVSQNTNTKLHRVAEDVVTTVQGGTLSGTVRRHVIAAVTALRAASEPEPCRDDAAPPPAVQAAQEGRRARARSSLLKEAPTGRLQRKGACPGRDGDQPDGASARRTRV
ncbi:ANTAR domain-containing protein [Streptomyces sp. NPDC091209]|uniref:ANTAR domain-containing protein n=1 Tax=Streptomyces sp. NPDC091209 TaxID=3365974 RepID=UPI0037FDD0CE